MRVILRRKLTYTIKGDAYWAADKLRKHIAQSLEEIEMFQTGPIDGEQFWFKTKFWYRWNFYNKRYFMSSVRFLRGIYQGMITVSHNLNQVVVAYEIDFTSSLVITGLIVGCFLLFAGCNFARTAISFTADRSSSLLLLVISPFLLLWLFWIGVISALPYLMIIYQFGRFLKSSVNKFFRLMTELGVPLEVIDSH